MIWWYLSRRTKQERKEKGSCIAPIRKIDFPNHSIKPRNEYIERKRNDVKEKKETEERKGSLSHTSKAKTRNPKKRP